MSQQTDEVIMHRVKQGQLSGLTILFDRYHVPLYNFFLKLTADATISEDLTQNVFYRVIRYRSSFAAESGSFRAWIYRMARNIHIDFCRQRPVFQELTGAEGERAGRGGDGYGEEQFQRLDEALRLLPESAREVLVLSRFQGLKYEEIARIKEISVAAVKVQVHRAIGQLRKLYFKELEKNI